MRRAALHGIAVLFLLMAVEGALAGTTGKIAGRACKARRIRIMLMGKPPFRQRGKFLGPEQSFPFAHLTAPVILRSAYRPRALRMRS